MSASDGTPLAGVPGWSGGHVSKLAGYGYTTADQVVGMAATPTGMGGLCSILGVTKAEAGRLVAKARAALPRARAAELGRPADTSGYGLGALPPPGDD